MLEKLYKAKWEAQQQSGRWFPIAHTIGYIFKWSTTTLQFPTKRSRLKYLESTLNSLEKKYAYIIPSRYGIPSQHIFL